MKLQIATPQEIAQLNGLRWRLWHYTASHDHLTAEIFVTPDKPSYISFMLCEHIVVPTHCLIENSALKQEREDLVCFQAKGIEIFCREVVLHAELIK